MKIGKNISYIFLKEGNFIWDRTRTPLDYTNWDHGEPNNDDGNQDCVRLKWDHRKWDDDNCQTRRRPICQKF